jgi:hypothetical protein
MGMERYIRDSTTGAAFLCDPQAVSAFRQKKTVDEEIALLKAEINTLKHEIELLKNPLMTPTESQ